ncbi:MAG: AAA family ATPase [Salinivirgaceae bacterium]|nr:AAA family ATPase [Salinivirgaceae bacterium]
MDRDERYEINSEGAIVVGVPEMLTAAERKTLIEEMFSINGWEYSLLNEITQSHYIIQLKNDNLQIDKTIHLYHGNVRKEDPERSREEKKIQLGPENDPRANIEDGIILGFYVYENKTSLENSVVVAWPIEADKNYSANPSLRVNMKTDILPAKNIGYHIDTMTTKRLVAFRPEFIYHYIDNYKNLQQRVLHVENTENEQTVGNVKFKTGYKTEKKFPRNRIFFGAPGTGKSFTLNMEKDELLADGGEYERVTFHPDYSYTNFVGTYKPVPCKDSDGKDAITYEYVPGPFMRTYIKALENSKTAEPKPFLLIVEEINRANVAAVFGDIFQLLDRDESEVSEYPVQASEDIKKHLVDKLGGTLDDYKEIRIPDNMFIWATMNSADQGVFPMDTAFKRRWDFTYLGINVSEAKIKGKTVELGQGINKRIVEWNVLRKAINAELLSYKVNEDKLLGPYFLSKKIIPENTPIEPAKFIATFKSKVIMYLFDDAAKQKRQTLFDGCDDRTKYSSICKEFDSKGVFIFTKNISDKFPSPTADQQ